MFSVNGSAVSVSLGSRKRKKERSRRDEKKNAVQKDPRGCPHVLFGSSIADFVIMAFVCRRESKETGSRM